MSEDNPSPEGAEPKGAEGKRAGTPKRRKIALIALALVVVVGGGAAARYGLPKLFAAHQAKERGATVFRCLFGDPPKPGERPEQRLRRIFLTAVGLSGQEKPTASGPGWPGRCSPHADELAEALKRAGRPEAAPPSDLGKHALDVADRMFDKPAFPLVELWEMAAADGGPLTMPLPPAPAPALDLDAPNLDERIAFGDLSSDLVPGRGLRLLLRGERGGPPLVFDFAEGLEKAHSAPLASRAKSSRPMLWPASDLEGPALVTDRSGARSTFFRADTGQSFGDPYEVVGGFSLSNERVGLVETELGKNGEERAMWLSRSEGTKTLDRTRITPPPGVPFASVHVLGPALVWIERRAGKPHLLLRSLDEKPAPIGPIEDAGELSTDAAHLSACRTEKGFAIVAREGDDVWMVLREPGSKARITHVGQQSSRGSTVVSEQISCSGDAATTTRVLKRKDGARDVYTIELAKCSRDGACENSLISLDDILRDRDPAEAPAPLDGDEGPVLAGSIGASMIVAWRTANAGVRVRLGPPRKIPSAPDLVVYDEASQDVNAAGRLHAMRLFARPGAALLLLHAVSGIKAIRVGEDGRISAVKPGS